MKVTSLKSAMDSFILNSAVCILAWLGYIQVANDRVMVGISIGVYSIFLWYWVNHKLNGEVK